MLQYLQYWPKNLFSDLFLDSMVAYSNFTCCFTLHWMFFLVFLWLFSVGKATLELQMSDRLSIFLLSKPLSLSESWLLSIIPISHRRFSSLQEVMVFLGLLPRDAGTSWNIIFNRNSTQPSWILWQKFQLSWDEFPIENDVSTGPCISW